MRFHITTHQCGRYDRDGPIPVVALHAFRDAERDAGGGWVKSGNFSVT